ncbi:MAG: ABC transporter permease subunit [Candidatus Latescibacteria bacterium]|nr:ABC transporter permease subunit [Candidatus Latescibacterota bacterium]NIO27311.1 ABC transporter permease subunit [Candidatus Latescibacterota bacterium]NIO54835.1 ABC transporter permease subunit [Candidatus Latescibacterota bacterium]NIT00918.1 ABC transporter permease subunit [Candidatus Latescibacterota bacterium]NIT37841.1 ABC transporter permease subunit [Candidatus Latescibacterota bacterium]
MVLFLIRRTLYATLLVFITITATFFILRFAPGDPLNRYFSPDIDPRVMVSVRDQLGLDRPLPVQYIQWVWSFVRGDFGVSISEHRPVSAMLWEAIPRTLQLTVLALIIEVILGLALGMLAAARRYSLRDKALSFSFLILYSVPTFYLAYLLITFFSLKFQFLPSSGMSSIHALPTGLLSQAGDRLTHLILPVFVLGFGSAAGLARYMRGSVLDAIGQEYIRTARAKGLDEKRVFWLHAFKNALPPVLTVVGLSFPFLLGGSVIVEKVFAWPGMGSLMVDSIFARDYPVVLAANFIGACMVIAGNLLADVACALADPRIKLAYMGDRRDQ